MALVYDYTTLQDATWRQSTAAQIEYTNRIRVTGFTTSTYLEMLREFYDDVDRPQILDPADPVWPNILLRGWEVINVQCGAPIPEIVLELRYSEQSLSTSSQRVANKDGPVIYRQRSIALDEVKTETASHTSAGNPVPNAPMELDYKGCKTLANVTIQRSLMMYTCERYEDENPEPRARNLLSKVNEFTWNGRAPRTVLFYDMNSDTRDDGATYFVNYSFLYDPETHDREVFYIGQDGTTPIDYKTEPGATLTPEVYEQADFSPLNIVIPFA